MALGTTGSVRVHGLRELNRAFAKLSKDEARELKEELVRVGEPVRAAAERLAVADIRNLAEGDRWGRMRLGVTSRLVYVAPRARRRGGSPRKNLAPLLLERAMFPAVDQNEHRVRAGLKRMLDRVGRQAGF